MAVKIFRVVAVVLIVILLGLVTVNLVIYDTKAPNRAIIVVHGMAGGGLVDKDGNPFWDPYGGDLYYRDFFDNPLAMVANILLGKDYSKITSKVLDEVLSNDPNSILNRLASDEDGNIKDNGIVAATMDSALPYGPLKAYKDIYKGLYDEFGDIVEVVMFQYDFRQDNRISAQKLEEFIDENGWNEVIICAHSMGCITTSSYLASSQKNRDKVLGFMSMAGPLLGATNALAVLENPNFYIGGIYDMLDSSPMLKKALGDQINDIIQDQVLPIIFNMASVGQLLPSIEYAHLLKEYYGEAFLTVDGNEITTEEELMNFYLSRPWARKLNGTTKAYMLDMPNFMNSMFGYENETKYHITQIVNTFYFAGSGLNTTLGAKQSNGKTTLFDAPLGDGTVPLYSATLGLDPKENNNVKIYEGKSHLDIGMLYEGKFAQDLAAAIRYLL